MSDSQNVLVVCTSNLQRSPTAERMIREHAPDRYDVRSAGIDPLAETQVTQAHVDWADMIIVMETMHRAWINEHCDVGGTPIHVLDIPDRYMRDDPELVHRLRAGLDAILDIDW